MQFVAAGLHGPCGVDLRKLFAVDRVAARGGFGDGLFDEPGVVLFALSRLAAPVSA